MVFLLAHKLAVRTHGAARQSTESRGKRAGSSCSWTIKSTLLASGDSQIPLCCPLHICKPFFFNTYSILRVGALLSVMSLVWGVFPSLEVAWDLAFLVIYLPLFFSKAQNGEILICVLNHATLSRLLSVAFCNDPTGHQSLCALSLLFKDRK